MYSRKIKLTRFKLIYLNGSTADVYYPGAVSSNTLRRRLKKGDPVVTRVNDEYKIALVSTTNLIDAVLLGYAVLRVKTDIFWPYNGKHY